jgi:hypothetical protein
MVNEFLPACADAGVRCIGASFGGRRRPETGFDLHCVAGHVVPSVWVHPNCNELQFRGLGCDEARIHHKPLTADQGLVQAALHHIIEEPQDDAA